MTTSAQRKRDHASIAAYAGIAVVLLGSIISGCIAVGRQAQRIEALEKRITANTQKLVNQSEQAWMLAEEVARIRAQQEILHHLRQGE